MQGFAEVKKQAEILGICVADEFKVRRYFKTEKDKIRELESIIEQLDQFNNTEGNNNDATSNLAIYSHETSQDKLSEAWNRQSIIVIKVHDKLHEKLFISTYSFL